MLQINWQSWIVGLSQVWLPKTHLIMLMVVLWYWPEGLGCCANASQNYLPIFFEKGFLLGDLKLFHRTYLISVEVIVTFKIYYLRLRSPIKSFWNIYIHCPINDDLELLPLKALHNFSLSKLERRIIGHDLNWKDAY